MAKYAAFAAPPAAVTSTIAKAQTRQPFLSVVGSVRAVNGVLVSTDLVQHRHPDFLRVRHRSP